MKLPVIGAIALYAAAVLAALTLFDDVGAGRAPAAPPPAGNGEKLLSELQAAIPLPDVELHDLEQLVPKQGTDVRGPSYTIATVRDGRKVQLRESPNGRVIGRLDDRTEFGSQQTLWVARVQGEWFGVPVPELPNGRLGWIRNDSSQLELSETNFSVEADISERRLELRFGKRVLDRFDVTVGAPGTPTPPGAYAITDGLAGKGVGPYYGCCILALSGHQPNLPSDWLGGDRIAIHGTPGEVGIAGSNGCLRARDVDMVSLFARVPLGAPVFIRS